MTLFYLVLASLHTILCNVDSQYKSMNIGAQLVCLGIVATVATAAAWMHELIAKLIHMTM